PPGPAVRAGVAAGRARDLRVAAARAGARRVRRARGSDRAQRVRRRHMGGGRAGDPAPDGAARLRPRQAARAPPRLPRHRRDGPLPRRAHRVRPGARARRLERVGDRRGRAPRDPRPVSVRNRRPPGGERIALRTRGRRDHGARAGARPRAGAGALAARRSRPSRRDGRGDARGSEAGRGRGDRRRAGCDGVMKGRKLWFVGIGGAGMSAYAQLARAWGAEVGGWDRNDTPYLEPLRDVRIEIAPQPVVPDGWEAVVSSAYPSVPGMRRPEFTRELVASRPSIVVGGTHGKGTTAAMIAYALREAGRDPAWLVGAPVPQLGSNAGFGSGLLVVEGDESDRTV